MNIENRRTFLRKKLENATMKYFLIQDEKIKAKNEDETKELEKELEMCPAPGFKNGQHKKKELDKNGPDLYDKKMAK